MLSSIWIVSCAQFARSHEVTPTIGDLTVENGQLLLSLRLNVEAFVAGIDLDGMVDTNNSDKSGRYDALRALDEKDLAPQVRNWAPGWLATIDIQAEGPVALTLSDVRIDPVDNPDFARASFLVLTGEVPVTARSLTVGWPKGSGDLVLRQQGVEDPYTGLIAAGEVSEPIALSGGFSQSGLETFALYIPVGFDHILPKGLDHILFVLGLFFLTVRLGALLWQISAFTLAHTITLALGALGWVAVPAAIVEPLIAASITYVAIENMLTSRLHAWRPFVVFGFGLLHGLGFASVLGEFGLPEGQFIPALLGFNVGVELGQLTVIAIAFLAVGYWFGQKEYYHRLIAVPASAVIGLVGAYWFVERVFL